MTLELKEEERAELEALVTGRMSDQLMEIAGTDSLDLREALTRRAIVQNARGQQARDRVPRSFGLERPQVRLGQAMTQPPSTLRTWPVM